MNSFYFVTHRLESRWLFALISISGYWTRVFFLCFMQMCIGTLLIGFSSRSPLLRRCIGRCQCCQIQRRAWILIIFRIIRLRKTRNRLKLQWCQSILLFVLLRFFDIVWRSWTQNITKVVNCWRQRCTSLKWCSIADKHRPENHHWPRHVKARRWGNSSQLKSKNKNIN